MDEPLDRALAWLSTQQSSMERLLAELVEISSHTLDPAGTSAVAARYAAALAALGGDALQGGVVPPQRDTCGAHVVVQTPVADLGEAVLLVGHHDTVFPRASFSGFREDGPRLRGPGVLDMKGGLVVMAFALGALREAGLLARVPLRLVTIADEETGSHDGRALVLEGARAAACALVFESGRSADQIVTRRKGLGGLTVRAHGKAAHAGNRHAEGVNAILALARFIERAEALTDYERGITVNVGKVLGGIGKNTVPDRAEALVDFRYLTAPEGAVLVAALEKAALDAAASLPGARIEIEGGISRVPLERTAATRALLAEYAACAETSGLGAGEAPLIGGGSDANTVAAVGVPAIDGLGPRGEGFHTVDEFIERDTLVPKTAALVRFLAGRARA